MPASLSPSNKPNKFQDFVKTHVFGLKTKNLNSENSFGKIGKSDKIDFDGQVSTFRDESPKKPGNSENRKSAKAEKSHKFFENENLPKNQGQIPEKKGLKLAKVDENEEL